MTEIDDEDTSPDCEQAMLDATGIDVSGDEADATEAPAAEAPAPTEATGRGPGPGDHRAPTPPTTEAPKTE